MLILKTDKTDKKKGVVTLKKRSLILLLTLALFSLAGCQNKSELTNKPNSSINESTEAGNEDNSTITNADISKEDSDNKEELKDNDIINEEENENIDENNIANADNKDVNTNGRIYYFEGFSETNYYLNVNLPEDKEQKVKFIVESLKSLPNNDYLESVESQEFTPLDSSVSVKSVEFSNNLVKIDFDKSFTHGLGSSGETSVIESLVKSVGYNLGVDNVIITFNNENYSSGHIEMEDGEAFSVNNNKSVELKNMKDR